LLVLHLPSTPVSHSSLPRRGFLGRLSAAVAAFSAGAVLPAAAAAQSRTDAPASDDEVHALDKWITAMPGKHKLVLDVVTPEHVAEVAYARNFLTGSTTDYGLGDGDHAVIVVLRHTATPWGYNDAVWAKYGVGERINVKAPRSEDFATRNPLFKTADGRDGMLAQLAARGVHFAMCGLSTTRYSQEWARALGGGVTPQQVREDLVANLLPNGHVMPAGVVACQRAQELGFAYLYVG
jgi:intracellular sulfur oxidation DsrE/DsrF family protein